MLGTDAFLTLGGAAGAVSASFLIVAGLTGTFRKSEKDSTQATIELLETQLKIERQERQAENEKHKESSSRHDQEIEQLRKDHENETHKLNAKMDLLTTEFANTIAGKVIPPILEAVNG